MAQYYPTEVTLLWGYDGPVATHYSGGILQKLTNFFHGFAVQYKNYKNLLNLWHYNNDFDLKAVNGISLQPFTENLLLIG